MCVWCMRQVIERERERGRERIREMGKERARGKYVCVYHGECETDNRERERERERGGRELEQRG